MHIKQEKSNYCKRLMDSGVWNKNIARSHLCSYGTHMEWTALPHSSAARPWQNYIHGFLGGKTSFYGPVRRTSNHTLLSRVLNSPQNNHKLKNCVSKKCMKYAMCDFKNSNFFKIHLVHSSLWENFWYFSATARRWIDKKLCWKINRNYNQTGTWEPGGLYGQVQWTPLLR